MIIPLGTSVVLNIFLLKRHAMMFKFALAISDNDCNGISTVILIVYFTDQKSDF